MNQQIKSSNIPTILVTLGATGDLIGRKIIPTLFSLFEQDKLPKMFKVVGFSRQPLSNEVFRGKVRESLEKKITTKPEQNQLNKFLELFSYEKGFFDNVEDYKSLNRNLKKIDEEWGVCTNKLFYLAVPPEFDEVIFKNLDKSGLTEPCSPEEGWTRVIIEKPFGKDLETANSLNSLLTEFFKEVQIYRIDHYLAKEMLQNILVFRFSNNLFENDWNNKTIEKIDIRILEKIGVEDRGGFYDTVGALRDVGQNHLLQMLAVLTMDQPSSFETEEIRKSRTEILKTLKIPTQEEATKTSFRAQYDGYRDTAKVNPNSNTETYFKIKAFLDAPNWRDVPITLEGGKALSEARKEIVVTFKHRTPCLCMDQEIHHKNRLIIRLEPKEEITIQFWAKKPGHEMEVEERVLNFLYRDGREHIQYTEEYGKLILDCIAGDQTLFVTTDEIKAMWEFIDPFVKAWDKNLVPLKTYKPDTDSIIEESNSVL